MGVRNGAQYLDSLKDDRLIIYDGRPVGSVADEPGLRNTAKVVAQFYDFQTSAENLDSMTYCTADGERVGMAFKEARTKDALRQRAVAYGLWAEVTCGFMGRSPDYMNSFLSTLGSVSVLLSDVDPQLGERARNIYLEARSRDLCYTHTFAEPFKVLPAPPHEPAPACIVVRETDDGLVIRGARALATLAPFANMNFDLPGGAACRHNDIPYLCGFVTPVAAPGLRWICRDKHDVNHTDSRLAARLDEMDCVAIFDDCLIPWSSVYMFVPLSAALPGFDYVMSVLQHHVLIRSIAKTRFVLGLAHLIAESSRVNQFINVQERLGEMVCWLRTLEAFAVAAVEDAVFEERSQIFYPNPRTTEVAGIWAAQLYPRMISHLLDLGGSRHVSTTQERTLDLLGDLAEQHFRGDSTDAKENIALFRLAWEVAGSTWGARQDLYERFHFGDATLRKVGGYLRFDRSQAVEMVRRILSSPLQSDAIFPVPKRN